MLSELQRFAEFRSWTTIQLYIYVESAYRPKRDLFEIYEIACDRYLRKEGIDTEEDDPGFDSEAPLIEIEKLQMLVRVRLGEDFDGA